MNDLEFSLDVLKSIHKEAHRADMTFSEKAGLYSATQEMRRIFEEFVDEEFDGNSYAREKIHKFQFHVSAALGFDVTNGHDGSQHLSWALGELQRLMGILLKKT